MIRFIVALIASSFLTSCVSGGAITSATEAAPFPDPYVLDVLLPQSGDLSSGQLSRARNQFLPMVGRDDLVEPRQQRPACTPLTDDGRAIDPVSAIVERAREARVVIINEAHDAPQDRAFIADVARALRPLGYDIYAAEALDPSRMTNSAPFPTMSDGFYSTEPVFGDLLREVRALRYRVVSYEDMSQDISGDELEQSERREQAQAENLVANVFRENARARVLIHVGYSHARELPERQSDGREQRWMALRLKEMIGTDPLTIDQTSYASPGQSHVVCGSFEQGALDQGMDLYVGAPALTFQAGRPSWPLRRGYRQIDAPRALRASDEDIIIVAHFEHEPVSAVPADRLLLRSGENVPLLLKPGRYRISAWTRTAGWTRSSALTVRH